MLTEHISSIVEYDVNQMLKYSEGITYHSGSTYLNGSPTGLMQRIMWRLLRTLSTRKEKMESGTSGIPAALAAGARADLTWMTSNRGGGEKRVLKDLHVYSLPP